MSRVSITINVDQRRRKRRLSLHSFGPVREQYLSLRPQEGVPMLAILTDSQEGDLTYGKPVDRKGVETSVQAGSVVWKTSDANVASVTPLSEDPISGTLVANLPGVCQVWPEADADLGDGVKTIVGEKVDVQVTGGEATGFGSPTFGAVREQP